MAQTGENVGSLILSEFVDDASHSQSNMREDRTKTDCLKDLVQRIANEMAVPQYRLEEMVGKVLAVVGPSIEERVRRELQEQLESGQRKQNESLAG